MRESEIVTVKLSKNAVLTFAAGILLLIVSGGCKEKAETKKPVKEFPTPGVELAGPKKNRTDSSTTQTPTTQSIRIQVQVAPNDATVVFDGTAIPLSPDSTYQFETVSQPVTIAVQKTGWRPIERTIDPANGNSQMFIALSPDPQWWLQQARQQFDNGELLAALQSVGATEMLQPGDIAVKQLKLQIFLQLERPKMAEEQLSNVLAMGVSPEGFTEERIQLALQFAQRAAENNMPQQVLEQLTAAIVLGCNAPLAFYQRGLACVDLDLLDQAMGDLNSVTSRDAALGLKLQAALVEPLINRARASQRRNDINAMLTDIQSVLLFSPDNVRALLIRSEAMNASGRFDQAVADCQQILSVSPDQNDARFEYAFALTGQKQYEAAIDAFHYVLQSGQMQSNQKHAAALKNRGFCYLEIRQVTNALKDLDKSIQIDPSNPESHFLNGMGLLKSNQPNKALQNFQRSLELTQELGLESDADTHYYTAVAMEELGKQNEALEQYSQAITTQSGHTAARLNRCILLTNQGNGALAITDASFILQANPNHAIALNSRGAAHVTLNQLDRALADFDAAIKNSPSYAEAWFNRANLHFNQQRYSKAIDDYSVAVEHDPDTSAFYLGRAKAAMQLGEYENAEKDLKIVLDRDSKNDEAVKLMNLIPSQRWP